MFDTHGVGGGHDCSLYTCEQMECECRRYGTLFQHSRRKSNNNSGFCQLGWMFGRQQKISCEMLLWNKDFVLTKWSCH